MLALPGDVPPSGQPIEDRLTDSGPAGIILAIARALPALADRLAAGTLPGDPAAWVGDNTTGDAQKALDLGAHHHILDALRGQGVRLVLSEEAEEIAELDPEGAWDVAMDPIDGSDSIGIGAPLGLLFSILPAAPEGFLRTGRAIVAAGYASFGHSLDMGFSLGDGVSIATHDRQAGLFRIAHPQVTLAPAASVIAYNASNERHWPPGLQAHVRGLVEGRDGPRERDFNMRWLASAVGELHRILLRGGVFMYPADGRMGKERGHLRLVYEAAPIAFLIEQAGGAAHDGAVPILDILPDHPHQKTPLFFGAAEELDLLRRCLSTPD